MASAAMAVLSLVKKLRAYRWTEAGGFLGLGSSTDAATAVSADGAVVIGASKAGFGGGGFSHWTEAGGLQDLGHLPGHTQAMATSLNANGSVIVGISTDGYLAKDGVGGTVNYDPQVARAFYWTAATGMKDLTQLLEDAGADMTNLTIAAALGISPSGDWIGGRGVTPGAGSGQVITVLATLLESSLPGDFNGNGHVDGADYVVSRKTGSGQTAYNTWRSNFGKPDTGFASALADPVLEPSSVHLLVASSSL